MLFSLFQQKSFTTASTLSSNSTSEENISMRSSRDNASKADHSETASMRSALESISSAGPEDNIHASSESIEDKEEQLVYLITNILFTILWRGIENNGGDSWKVARRPASWTFCHPPILRSMIIFLLSGTRSGASLYQPIGVE